MGASRNVLFRVEVSNEKETHVHFIEKDSFTIGRGRNIDLSIDWKGISREHLVVTSNVRDIFIRDLNSAFGTFVSEQKISHGDQHYPMGHPIKLGSCPDVIRIYLFKQALSREDEANEIIQNAAKQADEIKRNSLKEAQTLREETLRNVQIAASDLKRKAENEARHVLEVSRDRAQEIISGADQRGHELLQEAERKNVLAREQTEKQCTHLLEEARKSVLALRNSGEKEVAALISQTHQQQFETKKRIESAAQKAFDQVLEKSKLLFEQRQNEASKIVKEAHEAAVHIKAQGQKDAQSLLLEASNSVAEIKKKADSEALSIIDQAHVKGAEILKQREIEAQLLLSKAQQSCEDLIRKTEIHRTEMLDKERENLEALRREEEKRIASITNAAGAKAHEIVSNAQKSASDVRDSVRVEVEEILRKADQKGLAVVAKAQEKAKGIVQDSYRDAEQVRIENLKECEKEREKIFQFEKECQNRIDIANQERSLIEEEIESLKKERDQQQSYIGKINNEIDDWKRKRDEVQVLYEKSQIEYNERQEDLDIEIQSQSLRLKEIESTHQTLVEQAEVARRDISEAAMKRTVVEEKLREAQDYAEKIMDRANERKSLTERDVDLILEKKKQLEVQLENLAKEIESTAQKAKNELESELATRRYQAMAEIEDQELAVSNEVKRQLEDGIEEISRHLTSAVKAHIEDMLSDPNHLKSMDSIAKRIDVIVKKVLTKEYVPGEDEVKTLMGYDRERTKRIRKKWKRAASYAAVPLLLVALHWIFPGFYSMLFRSSDSEKSARSIYMDDIKKSHEKVFFVPKKDESYRDNYTENILYTNHFVETWENKDQWIPKLNEFFVEELKIGENVIVKFIAGENELVQSLLTMSKEVTVKNQVRDIAKMQEFENESLSSLENLVGGPENFQKYLEFKKRYYLDSKEEFRSPAQQ